MSNIKDFVIQPLLKKLNKKNIITRLERVERSTQARPSARVGRLAELSQATGDLIVVGDVSLIDPETGRETVRLDNDGKIYAGEGAVVLDQDGVNIEDGGDAIAFHDSNTFMYGVLSIAENNISAFRGLRLLGANVTTETNLLINSDFETGDLSGWTETDPGGTISISALGDGYGGGYAAHFANSVSDYITQTIASSPKGLLLIFRMKSVAGSGSLTVIANGVMLMSEFTTVGEWRNFYTVVPGSTTSLELHVTGADCYVDDIVALPLSSAGATGAASWIDVVPNGIYLHSHSLQLYDINDNSIVHINTDNTPVIYVNTDMIDVDTIIRGNTDADLVHVDAGLDAVGMGGAAVSGQKLTVYGKTNLAGSPVTTNMLTNAPDAIGQGTWERAINTGCFYNGVYQNTATHADEDNFTVNMYLPAGTYTVRFNAVKGANRPIVKVEVGATNLGNTDLYAAATDLLNIVEYTGLVVATGGIYAVKFTVNSKNALSTDYYLAVSQIEFKRTA